MESFLFSIKVICSHMIGEHDDCHPRFCKEAADRCNDLIYIDLAMAYS